MTRKRCAIYTRKSSEEGLDQDFNSLDAQREACEAYIKSQAGEGWQPLRGRYDDGGLSGGTLERPALQRLLADIEANKVDTVVVYKVDRLTRSLSDFARIVEVFDTHGVSFVSVTQQFNTTTSMGRLTLNMLLSFAQFEREVTGERIRDKIAASKKKGLWMGGFVPLGYDVIERKLVVNEAEAATVRKLFQLYLERGTVGRVQQEAKHLGLRTKARRPTNGNRAGGTVFTQGHLYKLLANPIYIGEITHKGARYQGEHEGIIEREIWDAVQAQLAANATARHHRTNAKAPSRLVGLLYDGRDRPMKPSHATKAGRRYRYYITRPSENSPSEDTWRLPAAAVEDAVRQGLQAFLRDQARLIDTLHLTANSSHHLKMVLTQATDLSDRLPKDSPADLQALYREIFKKIRIERDRLCICLDVGALRQHLGAIESKNQPTGRENFWETEAIVTVPMTLKRRGVETKLVIGELSDKSPSPDSKLVALVTRGRTWFEQMKCGEVRSVREIASRNGMHHGDVSRILRLAFLAPDIVEAILDGLQPADLTATRLKRLAELPLSWSEQRRILGFG